jgi:hypothetical protein
LEGSTGFILILVSDVIFVPLTLTLDGVSNAGLRYIESLGTGENRRVFGYGYPVPEENDSLAIMSFLGVNLVWDGQRGLQILINGLERGIVAEEDVVPGESLIVYYLRMPWECREKGYYGRDIHIPGR